MAYLRGDYYGGDYYGGDPFLGGLLSLGSKLIGGGLGALFGGKKSTTLSSPSSVGVMASGGGTVNAAASGVNPGSLGGAITAWMQAHPVLSAIGGAVGGAGITGALGLLQAGATPLPGAVMGGAFGIRGRRMHPNKSTYVVRGGGTSHYPPGMNLVLKGTALVPTRRMNVANGRALRRALRRVAGFAKTVKRVRRAVSMASSAVGVRHHAKGKAVRRR